MFKYLDDGTLDVFRIIINMLSTPNFGLNNLENSL